MSLSKFSKVWNLTNIREVLEPDEIVDLDYGIEIGIIEDRDCDTPALWWESCIHNYNMMRCGYDACYDTYKRLARIGREE